MTIQSLADAVLAINAPATHTPAQPAKPAARRVRRVTRHIGRGLPKAAQHYAAALGIDGRTLSLTDAHALVQLSNLPRHTPEQSAGLQALTAALASGRTRLSPKAQAAFGSPEQFAKVLVAGWQSIVL